MNFDFSPEQDAFRSVVRNFSQQVLAPNAAEWDQQGVFPTDVVRQMGELGLFGLLVPEDLGGSGADFTTFCIAVEELAAVDSSIAITLSAGVGLGIGPILSFGSEAQRNHWLPDMAAGRALGAFGLTEADSGSDAGSLRTRAVLDGDEWVIDGAKEFITNSGTPLTRVITVAARTEDGISAFLVPADTPGLTVERAYKKMGWRASDTHPLRFDGCRIPHANLLGTPGQGFKQFLQILDGGRIAIAALALGLARACLDVCVTYANERSAFGGPIARFQGVSFPIADLAVAVESARLLTYQAAWLKDQGRPSGHVAAIAKLQATEAAVDAGRTATQIFGGSGFLEETPANRYYRDAKILEIGEGTSEIQRLVIARGLGLQSAS
ncbi:MAG: acyl-CoA dehydrogenase family protein [Actinomycetes bacterium]